MILGIRFVASLGSPSECDDVGWSLLLLLPCFLFVVWSEGSERVCSLLSSVASCLPGRSSGVLWV